MYDSFVSHLFAFVKDKKVKTRNYFTSLMAIEAYMYTSFETEPPNPVKHINITFPFIDLARKSSITFAMMLTKVLNSYTHIIYHFHRQ